jgi:hypothetical protein
MQAVTCSTRPSIAATQVEDAPPSRRRRVHDLLYLVVRKKTRVSSQMASVVVMDSRAISGSVMVGLLSSPPVVQGWFPVRR